MTDYEQFLEENGLTEADCEREKATINFWPPSPLEQSALCISPSRIEGIGVFATEGLPGDIDWPVAMSGGKWTNSGRYINHSPNPNCDFYEVPDGYNFRTLRKIRKGEELTVNYRQIKSVINKTNNRGVSYLRIIKLQNGGAALVAQ